VDVVAPVGAQQESAAVMEPGEGAFDDPAVASEPRSVFGLAASDDRFDASLPDKPSVLVVVVAAIGKDRLWATTGPTATTAHRWDSVEQLEQLRDVVAVGGRECPGERQATAVYEDVMLAAAPAAVDRAGTGFRAPFFACR
jgi:hypothetical protein